MSKEKEEKFGLEEAIQELNKKFGENYINTSSKVQPIPRITTGIFSLDYGIGGGMPLKKVMTIALIN